MPAIDEGVEVTYESEAIRVWLTDSIVLVRYMNPPDNSQFERYLAAQERIMRSHFKGFRRSVVLDLRLTRDSKPTHRKMQAEWMARHADLLRQTTAGIGFVVEQTVMRAALWAVFWLTPAPVPFEVFSSVLEAEAWAEQHYIDTRYAVPNAV